MRGENDASNNGRDTPRPWHDFDRLGDWCARYIEAEFTKFAEPEAELAENLASGLERPVNELRKRDLDLAEPDAQLAPLLSRVIESSKSGSQRLAWARAVPYRRVDR